MLYRNLVYNLLTNGFWSITAALPGGLPGTRPDVGSPEIIPDITFIARQLNATDGFPTAQRNHLNGYIQDAQRFHTTYGLSPIAVNSFEDILNRFQTVTTPIGRMRFVSHGNDQFLFFPVFNNGLWSYGMHREYLQALQNDDEGGLRYLVTAQTTAPSPILIGGTDQIVSGMTSLNNAVVTPLGSPPSAAVRKFIEVVNDFYQVRNGTIAIETGNPVKTLIIGAQQAILNASLTLLENAIRAQITASGSTVTSTQLDAFKTAVLAATPVDLEFLGNSFSLSPTVIADVNTAMAATPPPSENDLRTAISGGTGEPLFRDFLSSLVAGVTLFNPTALRLGTPVPADPLDEATIRGNANLQSFVLTCVDLFFLKNGPVFIGTAAITAADRNTLRNAIMAISNIVRARAATGGITISQLNTLRTTIENLPLRQSAITGGFMIIDPKTFTELGAANAAIPNHFRDKLNHFRGLMSPSDQSKIDIRGCMVGKTQSFIDLLRDFFGTSANKPTITAPEWWQSFPFSWSVGPPATSPIAPVIDGIVSGGVSASHVTAADVATSFTTWTGLIDFDPHFNFITGLFASTASVRDFATLAWRVWQVGGTGAGIPVLRMEAKRVDDLASLNLGDLILRFATIFEIPAASTPNPASRTRLNSLQPHLATFKIKSDAVAAGPAAADLPQLATELTALATAITGISGMPTPTSPLPPASNALADIQTSVTNIGTYLDSALNTQLAAFFTAIQGKTAHANARIRYYYNIGLPLLLQSSAPQHVDYVLSMNFSSSSPADANTLLAAALRSWMRIQWSGTATQVATMNTLIGSMALTTSGQRSNAAQTPMLSDGDPQDAGTVDAGFCPTPTFHSHLVTKP